MITVYRYRVKSLNGLLNKQAKAVNYVWNYCNETQKYALRWWKKWPTGFDLINLTAGTSKDLGIHSGTIDQICLQYAKSRKQRNRPFLRWRTKSSLGWVPIKGRDLRETPNGFHFHGREFKLFKSRDLPIGAKIKDGTNFSRDARGNWFLNVCVEAPDAEPRPIIRAVGIDLGLKDLATLSTGEKIENPRHLEQKAEKLAVAQRARKKRQARNIHARIANNRSDFLHKLSHRIVREFDYIAVGDINAAGLAKTSMAKSVNDAGWSTFRNMLRFKAIRHGAWYEEVDERFSTQVCSACGKLPASRPRGIADLGIREWTCSDCGVCHDRDVNAAANILRVGHHSPVEGIGA